ncbi:MAG: hypothetical protein DRI39_08430 [Chloroflexi bacterium]|nr:MAG: hypothetical protein DRI39_08430 [Chloroflexota bacterium]
MSQPVEPPLGLSPFASLVGLCFTRVDREGTECVLAAEHRLLNVNGTVHGGVVYTMVDVGMGTALHVHLAPGERCATIETSISYLTAVSSGTLVCKSRLVHRSRALAVLESQVESDGRPVARARATFYISRGKPI